VTQNALLTAGVANPPLYVPASTEVSGNGVFLYGPGGQFPTNTFLGSNYWVDLVFVPDPADTTPPSVTNRTPAPGTTNALIQANVAVTFSEPVQQQSVSLVLQDASGTTVPSSLTYERSTRTFTLDPVASLSYNSPYTATLSGARDFAGNVMPPLTWSFATRALTCPCSVWDASALPAIPAQDDLSSVEVGVKVRADVAGSVTAVRFYKGPGNDGVHTGHLWTSDGQLLASVTFSNETAAGWQQAAFATPVAIQADTLYVVSYHAPQGHYAVTQNALLTAGVANPPLYVPASAEVSGNGVFLYGPGGQFPTNTFLGSNYWVDLVFVP
jgi:hypothetical protein